MEMKLQFFSRLDDKDDYYEGVGKTIDLSADIAPFLPEVGERIQLFNYVKGSSVYEWMAKYLSPHYCIVDKIEKVFHENDKGVISMRLHIFTTPVEYG